MFQQPQAAGLGVMNYESAYKKFPVKSGGTHTWVVMRSGSTATMTA